MPDQTARRRPPLVLMINDHEWSSRSFDSILGPAGYAVLRAYTGRKGLDRARTADPDMVIVDANLPDMDGLELCRELRDDPNISTSTPIIVTSSAHPTRQQRLAALRAGAWELLSHPLDAEELLVRFDTYTNAKLDADRARDQGLLDQLTGFYNLQGLARRARELVSQATRINGPLACVVFSAEAETEEEDDHETREALAKLAEVLRAGGRESDAIGRIGHHEIAIFAPGTDAAGAELLARRIAEAHNGNLDLSHLRAGYHAVDDLREAQLRPVDMLERASAALRASRKNGADGKWVEGFDHTVSLS